MHLRKRATQIPAPVVVPASGKFEGNDGKWSTFFINLNSDQKGVHGQDFRVLASTSSPITLVPGRTEWCDEECAARRGLLLFDGSQPRGMVPDQGTWSPAGLYDIPVPEWFSIDLKTSGNLTLRGNWGTTQVGLGQSDPSSLVLPGTYAVSYLFDSYFLGSFGLAYGAVGGPGATKSTFLTRFREANQITSVSYGYTAGAWYRNNNNGAPGSLVLGGYDQSRMTGSALSLRMPNAQNTTLIIGVPSIVYSPDPDVAANPSSFTATADCGGFSANVDSTLPYLILPDCICDQFQDTYGLTYDTTQNLYFVNASSHDTNKQQNGTVEFKIAAGPSDSGTYIIIKLGYPAFDHQISSVTGENGKNYFPIKKSKNGVFTLGRTFLQEAYIIVDYERSNFTVAPALYTDSLNKQDLRPIYNTTFDPTTSSASSGGGLGTGAIAGTVVGIVVAFAIAGVLAFCWWRKRKNKKQAEPLPHETSQIDPTLAGDQVKARRISELTGSDLPSSPKSPVGDYYSADHKNFPPISEMSPDSPPVELYSPPADSASDVDGRDYFTAGKTPHRRGAQRDRASSGYTTPGTPIAELPGDEGQYVVSPMTSPQPSRGPSDTSLNTNIDQRLADHKKDTERTSADAAAADDTVGPKDETQAEATTETEKERRPSHTRGLSDTTIASESTAVSQPTPEEEERWAREPALEPRRPLSE